MMNFLKLLAALWVATAIAAGIGLQQPFPFNMIALFLAIVFAIAFAPSIAWRRRHALRESAAPKAPQKEPRGETREQEQDRLLHDYSQAAERGVHGWDKGQVS